MESDAQLEKNLDRHHQEVRNALPQVSEFDSSDTAVHKGGRSVSTAGLTNFRQAAGKLIASSNNASLRNQPTTWTPEIICEYKEVNVLTKGCSC